MDPKKRMMMMMKMKKGTKNASSHSNLLLLMRKAKKKPQEETKGSKTVEDINKDDVPNPLTRRKLKAPLTRKLRYRRNSIGALKMMKGLPKLFPLVGIEMKKVMRKHQLRDFLFSTMDKIREEGMVEGIFRTTPDILQYNEIEHNLGNGHKYEDIAKSIDDCHMYSELIKNYIRNYKPNPLFECLLKIVDETKEKDLGGKNNEIIAKIQKVLRNQYTDHELIFISELLKLLKEVSLEEKTKMNPQNLGIVWTPNLYSRQNDKIEFIKFVSNKARYDKCVLFTAFIIEHQDKLNLFEIGDRKPAKLFFETIKKYCESKN